MTDTPPPTPAENLAAALARYDTLRDAVKTGLDVCIRMDADHAGHAGIIDATCLDGQGSEEYERISAYALGPTLDPSVNLMHPYRMVEDSARPGVLTLVDECGTTLAEVNGRWQPLTADDIITMARPVRPAWLVDLERAVNERIRNTWPR